MRLATLIFVGGDLYIFIINDDWLTRASNVLPQMDGILV